MWLEADCNLAGGEALVRQLLHGKEYFRKEFGKDNRILWLPDVFGVFGRAAADTQEVGHRLLHDDQAELGRSTTRPRMTRSCGRGLDGSEVLTHFIPTRDLVGDEHHSLTHFTTYNGDITPMQIAGGWNPLPAEGPGQPVPGQLRLWRRRRRPPPRRCSSISGAWRISCRACRARARALRASSSRSWTRACVTIAGCPSGGRASCTWRYHRGTYTAMAKNKRNNRKIEIELREVELWSTLAARLGGRIPRGRAA